MENTVLKALAEEVHGAHGESETGACGPTAVLLLAMLPPVIYRLRRK